VLNVCTVIVYNGIIVYMTQIRHIPHVSSSSWSDIWKSNSWPICRSSSTVGARTPGLRYCSEQIRGHPLTQSKGSYAAFVIKLLRDWTRSRALTDDNLFLVKHNTFSICNKCMTIHKEWQKLIFNLMTKDNKVA